MKEAAKEFHLPEELDLIGNFETVCGNILGDRRDFKNRFIYPSLKPPEDPDPVSHLFPEERKQSRELLETCSRYMNAEDSRFTARSLLYTLSVHQTQYRDSNRPYSEHLLWIANSLARKYQVDAITIASALLHDSLEDRKNSKKEDIIKNLTYDSASAAKAVEVAETVSTLSKNKSKKIRKVLIEEESRLAVIESLVNNPRVALIKTYDRLHNLLTLHEIRGGKPKRQKIINESVAFFIPLAKRLGLFDEADLMEDLCVLQIDEEYFRKGNDLNAQLTQFFEGDDFSKRKQELDDDIRSLLSISNGSQVTIKFRAPRIYDIYRKKPDLNNVGTDDFYLNVDLTLDGYDERDPIQSWGSKALEIRRILTWPPVSPKFHPTSSVDDHDFQENVQLGLLNSLPFKMRWLSKQFNLRVNIMPGFARKAEQVRMADLYYKTAPALMETEFIRSQSEIGESFGIADRHYEAYQKMQKISSALARIREKVATGGPMASQQIVRYLEPHLPEGYIQVVGEDDQKRQESWWIEGGKTILDYTRETFPEETGRNRTWRKLKTATVNGNRVDFNYQMKEGDIIHLGFDKEEQINPFWIHCTSNSEEKAHLKQIIQQRIDRAGGAFKKKLIMDVYAAGIKRLSNMLPPENRPVRVGVDEVMAIVNRYYPGISAGDFLWNMGIGEGDLSENIKMQMEVADHLKPLNQDVQPLDVYFSTNEPGQLYGVTSVLKKLRVNIPDADVMVFGENVGSIITIYLPPEEAANVSKIMRAINNNEHLDKLGLIHFVIE